MDAAAACVPPLLACSPPAAAHSAGVPAASNAFEKIVRPYSWGWPAFALAATADCVASVATAADDSAPAPTVPPEPYPQPAKATAGWRDWPKHWPKMASPQKSRPPRRSQVLTAKRGGFFWICR